jgi:hypothetical protein
MPGSSPITDRYHFFDFISRSMSRSAHVSTRSSGGFRADDRFIRAQNFGLYASLNQNIRQLCPKNLSLFDLAVLADCVHNFDPHYTKFKHTCFWFSSIICDVVAKEYDCTMVSSNSNENSLSTDLPTPCNSYLPAVEGRWMSILISDVGESELKDVTSKFQECLQQKTEEVRFDFYS